MIRFLIGICFAILFSTTKAAEEDIQLIFGGDVTLAGWYAEIVPDAYDYDWPFARLQTLFRSADLVMVNCETAITRAQKQEPKQFHFKMNPDLVEAFRRGNISLVTLANNHVYDYGAEGLRDTIRFLDAYGIGHVGAGMTLSEARKPVVRSIRGKTIAFLGYGNYSPATDKSPGTAYRYPEYIVHDIRAAKQSGAHIVIVNFHWGIERAKQPTEHDRSLAHLAIDNGADVVVGHHPHVLQPVEMYKGKVIAYSLGNFIFGGNRRSAQKSALLKITIGAQGEIGQQLLPVRIDTATRYQPYLIHPKTDLAKR